MLVNKALIYRDEERRELLDKLKLEIDARN
jgi:hypothetical protein